MKAQFGTVIGETTLRAHFKWFVAAVAKFIFTLATCEMHTPTSVKVHKFSITVFNRTNFTFNTMIIDYLASEYLNLHFGHEIPCNCKCWETPSNWRSGSLSSFHSANWSQVIPSCWTSHWKFIPPINPDNENPFKCNTWNADCTLIFNTYRFPTLCTRYTAAIWTNEPLLTRPSEKSWRTLESDCGKFNVNLNSLRSLIKHAHLNAPFEIRVLH